MIALEHPLTDDVVTIKPFDPADKPALVQGRDAEFRRFLSDASPEPAPAGCIWVAGTIVGWVDFDNDDRHWLTNDEVNVGYNVFAEHRVNGYGTRALELLVRFLLTQRPPLQPTLLIHPENTPSIALARRAGFEHVGEVDDEHLYKLGTNPDQSKPEQTKPELLIRKR